jgi:t-SNARE complex subunit (syntaxin)
MNRDLISELKQGDISNQNPEMTQVKIYVDEEFDSQNNYLQNELDIANNDIKRLRQLGTNLRSNVSTSKIYETNQMLDKLNLEISDRLRNVGNQIITLNQKTKNRPKDKTTPICEAMQRKIAYNFKTTFNEYNLVKHENQNEAYKIFSHQYRITKSTATESEIQKAFEENNNEPVFIKELSSTQTLRRALEESQRRNEDLKRIEKSIEELLEIFGDMQNMLNIQYDKINTIDDIVNHAEIAVDQASTELVKTVEIRKKSRKILWIITIIVVILLILLFIFIYINFIKPIVNTTSDVVDNFTPDKQNN